MTRVQSIRHNRFKLIRSIAVPVSHHDFIPNKHPGPAAITQLQAFVLADFLHAGKHKIARTRFRIFYK